MTLVDVSKTLALGTAQLGMPYGVANDRGQPDSVTAQEIVEASWTAGVRVFDTAQAYGSSERVLGTCLRELGVGEDVRVITKLHPDLDAASPAAVRESVIASRELIGPSSLWGLMLHREDQLRDWAHGWAPILELLRREELVGGVGISVYDPAAALQALETDGIDFVQVPANVFDRRMRRSGVFARASDLGKRVFTRSVYLQGLAAMDSALVPQGIEAGREAVSAYRRFCELKGLGPTRFAVEYALTTAPSSTLVIGAEDALQAAGNCRWVEEAVQREDWCREWDDAWPDDIGGLVDPSHWPAP